jgi:hypothetical protein
VLIPLIYIIYKKRQKRIELRNKVLADGTSNYKDVAKNIALSISKSKIIYKELIVKVHPDNPKFQNENKEIANELSSRITKSKKNYDELVKLKTEVDNFLNKL